jgi:hypothetical protein
LPALLFAVFEVKLFLELYSSQKPFLLLLAVLEVKVLLFDVMEMTKPSP